jgi:putative transcription antitermination factor YqgF
MFSPRPSPALVKGLYQILFPGVSLSTSVSKFARLEQTSPYTLLGMDVGDTFVGVAASDSSIYESHPLTVVKRRIPGPQMLRREFTPMTKATLNKMKHSKKGREKLKEKLDSAYIRPMVHVTLDTVASQIKEIVVAQRAIGIVVGLPLTLQGTFDEQTEATVAFIEEMKRLGALPPFIFWWDERYSSMDAREVLTDAGVRKDHHKQFLDKMVARDLLQSFMDHMEECVERERQRPP